MGVVGTRHHTHHEKTFVTADTQKVKEYQATPESWQSWWNINKAFVNKRDGRTFAQVLKQSKAQKQLPLIDKVICDSSHKNLTVQDHRKTY